MTDKPDFPLHDAFCAEISAAISPVGVNAPKGILHVDGALHPIDRIDSPVSGRAGFAYSVNQAQLDRIGRFVDVEALAFKGMRVTDLSPLAALPRLQRLQLWWVQKLTRLDGLRDMALDVLLLEDYKNASDLTPLASLGGLRALTLRGGIWNKQPCDGLAPLVGLPLGELQIGGLVLADGDLRRLAEIETLRDLWLSYGYPVESYAWLHAQRPDLRCEAFQPYLDVPHAHDGKTIMVMGKRKPMLDPKKDAKRLAKYVADWEALVEGFRV